MLELCVCPAGVDDNDEAGHTALDHATLCGQHTAMALLLTNRAIVKCE